MPAAHENSGEEASLSDSEPLKPPPQHVTHPDQHRVPVHTDYEHYPDIHNGAWIPPQSPIYRGPNPVTHSPHAPPTPSDGSHPHQPPPQDIHTQYNPQPYPSNPQYPVYHNDYPANGAKGNGSLLFETRFIKAKKSFCVGLTYFFFWMNSKRNPLSTYVRCY